ncbi:MAG: HU family DNA-binding protein [Bacteroidaceae bacterium]|nr:HU family DNA-binding protein [Bacteroidaceae bacterium]
MESKMTLQDLTVSFASRAGIRNNTADDFVRNFFELIALKVVEDKVVKVKSLGTFKLIEMSDRESVDVNTGERILIPGHSKISFTPDAALRDQVNKPFADFQTVILNEDTRIEDMEAFPVSSVDLPTDEDGDVEVPHIVIEDTPNVDGHGENPALPQDVVSSVDEGANAGTVEKTVGGNADAVKENEGANDDVAKEEEGTKDDRLEADIQEKDQEAEAVAAVQEASDVPAPQSLMMEAVPQVKIIHKGVSPWFTFAYVLLTLLLMAVSYYAGYRHLLNFDAPREVRTVRTQAAPKAEISVKSVTPAPVDSLTLARRRAMQASKQYPQVPGGKYLIVGTRRVHVMRVGDSLLKLALKEYGHKDFAQYIIVYNKFPNPDVISVGCEVKMPELIENVTE